MSSVEEKKFLKLLKFSEEIAAMVVRSFIKSNILINFEKSFKKFLHLHKHSIFHLWSNSIKCCECSVFLRKDERGLQEEQLKKLYILGKDTTNEHSIVNGNTVEQYCICDVKVNEQCSLDKLDISLTYTLIMHCVSLSPSEETWITTVKDIVNNLNDAESLSSFDKGTLDKWWTMLEGSVLGLASKVPPTFFEESVKTSIDLLTTEIEITYVEAEEKRVNIKADNKKSPSIRKQQEKTCTNKSPNQRDVVDEEPNENVQQVKGKTTETGCSDCFVECQMCHRSFCCNKCEKSLEKIEIMKKQYVKSCNLIKTLEKQDENNRQKIAQLEKQNNEIRERIKTKENQYELEREEIQTISKYRKRNCNIIKNFFENFEKAKREYCKMEEEEEHLIEEQQRKRARFDVDEEEIIRGPECQEGRDAKEVDENAPCAVCKHISPEENNEMIYCDGCELCVHQVCYGVESIPDGGWVCKTCEAGVKPKCALCPQSGGAMKITSDGSQWAHVNCAWWIQGVKFGNPNEMEPIVGIEQIPEGRWSLICSICHVKEGACIQCSVKSCTTSFHVTCAYASGLRMDAYCAEDKPDPVFKAYCKSHRNHIKPLKKKHI